MIRTSNNAQPHVLFLTNKWKTAGAEHVLLQEIQAFQKEGISAKYGAIYGSEVPPGLGEREVLFPQFKHLFDIGAYRRLLMMMRHAQVTHIVAVLDHAMIVARIVCLFAPRIRLVLVEAGMANRKPWRYKLFDILFNWRTHAVIAVSNGVAASLSYQKVYSSKIHVVPNGIQIKPRAVLTIRPNNRFSILAVGSLRKEKGFTTLLSAFASFLAHGGDGELTIIGKGSLREPLEQEARRLHIETKTRFLGERTPAEVEQWYRKADCFVFPSVSEGFGLVLVEAMSAGLPVIATRSAGALDIVEDQVSGLLVPINDPEALAGALYKLVADANLRERLGHHGRQRVQNLFSLEKHVRDMKRVLFI